MEEKKPQAREAQRSAWAVWSTLYNANAEGALANHQPHRALRVNLARVGTDIDAVAAPSPSTETFP